jgi:hypothetical protein
MPPTPRPPARGRSSSRHAHKYPAPRRQEPHRSTNRTSRSGDEQPPGHNLALGHPLRRSGSHSTASGDPAPGRAQHALQTARVDRPPPRRLGAQAGPAAQRAPQTDGVIPWPLDHRAPTAQLGRPLALEVVPSTHSRQRLRPEQQLALTCEMMPRVPAQSRRRQTRAAAAAQAAAVRAKMA